jgi:hypothetical protein
MAKRTAADQFVEILLAAGVRRMYGVVGDSLNPVVDAIRRHDGIDWVHVRHEEAGAFAAGAEAQLTGRLVACAGSCGPGNLHLINGLYDAHRSMAPVLALAAQIPSTEIGTGYFQGNGLPGPAVTSGWVVGDQLGEMGQQVGVAADAVLDQQAIAVQVAHGSVEPGPGSVHHHGGGVADPLGDQHAVRTGGRGCAR